jgi:hypothetical protein
VVGNCAHGRWTDTCFACWRDAGMPKKAPMHRGAAIYLQGTPNTPGKLREKIGVPVTAKRNRRPFDGVVRRAGRPRKNG